MTTIHHIRIENESEEGYQGDVIVNVPPFKKPADLIHEVNEMLMGGDLDLSIFAPYKDAVFVALIGVKNGLDSTIEARVQRFSIKNPIDEYRCPDLKQLKTYQPTKRNAKKPVFTHIRISNALDGGYQESIIVSCELEILHSDKTMLDHIGELVIKRDLDLDPYRVDGRLSIRAEGIINGESTLEVDDVDIKLPL